MGNTAWIPLEDLLAQQGVNRDAVGVAASHSKAARGEAARKLLGNHFNLLNDICNPRVLSTQNIIGSPLTQVEALLERVS